MQRLAAPRISTEKEPRGAYEVGDDGDCQILAIWGVLDAIQRT